MTRSGSHSRPSGISSAETSAAGMTMMPTTGMARPLASTP